MADTSNAAIRRPYDDKSFAPYIVHPLGADEFRQADSEEKRSAADGAWQRFGVYAAGLALSDAGIAGKRRPPRHAPT